MKILLTIAILALTIQPVLACPPTYKQWVGGVEQPIPTGCTYYDSDNNGVSELIQTPVGIFLYDHKDKMTQLLRHVDESDIRMRIDAKVKAAYYEHQNENLSGPGEKDDFELAPVIWITAVGAGMFLANQYHSTNGLFAFDEDKPLPLETKIHYDGDDVFYSIRYTIPLE